MFVSVSYGQNSEDDSLPSSLLSIVFAYRQLQLLLYNIFYIPFLLGRVNVLANVATCNCFMRSRGHETAGNLENNGPAAGVTGVHTTRLP